MMAASSGQSLADFTFVTPAFADHHDYKKAAKLAKDEADKDREKADLSKAHADAAENAAKEADDRAEELGTEDAQHEAEQAREDADKAEELAKDDAERADESANAAKDALDLAEAFHCPEGITTCYKADGSPYDDPNNLPATAAGPGGSGGGSTVVKPVHFRSF